MGMPLRQQLLRQKLLRAKLGVGEPEAVVETNGSTVSSSTKLATIGPLLGATGATGPHLAGMVDKDGPLFNLPAEADVELKQRVEEHENEMVDKANLEVKEEMGSEATGEELEKCNLGVNARRHHSAPNMGLLAHAEDPPTQEPREGQSGAIKIDQESWVGRQG